MSDKIDRNTVISNQLILRFWPLAGLFLITYTPISFFITGDYFAGWSLLVSLVVFVIIIYFYYQKRSVVWVGNILALIGYPVLIPWLFTGGPSGTDLWWSPIYVVWVFFITTKLWGFLWLSLYVVICTAIYIISILGYVTISYSGDVLLNILFAYAVTYCLVFFIGEIIMAYLDSTHKEMLRRKKAEEKIKEMNSDLEDKIIRYTKINSQLLDFCDMVSHSLRTPIVRMEMLSDAIEEAKNESEKMELFDHVRPVVKQFNEIFNELMETLQVQQETEMESDKIPVKEAAEKVLMGFERQIKSSQAEIKMDFNEASHVYFPYKYFDNILINLISNALKFTSPERKPEITIRTKKMKKSVILSVEDNGLGIDLSKHKDRLFKIRQVFHQVPSVRGFGLYLIKCQIEAMGGKIWVDSMEDKGSTFYVEFINQEQ